MTRDHGVVMARGLFPDETYGTQIGQKWSPMGTTCGRIMALWKWNGAEMRPEHGLCQPLRFLGFPTFSVPSFVVGLARAQGACFEAPLGQQVLVSRLSRPRRCFQRAFV